MKFSHESRVGRLLSGALFLGVALGPLPTQAGGFIEVDRLVPASPGNDDLFGNAVAVSGDTLVIGAVGDDNGGSIFVFERDPSGAWVEDDRLTPSDSSVLDDFGHSVAIDADTIVVGNPNSDGEVWVFERDMAGVWSETARLTAFDGAADDLGWSVAVLGDTIVAGAPGTSFAASGADPGSFGDVPLGTGAGALYLFERDGLGAWTAGPKLTDPEWDADPTTSTEDRLGFAVSISALRIVAGAPHHNSSDLGPGSVLIYEPDGLGGWDFDDRLTTPFFEGLGQTVATSADVIVVGHPRIDRAYVFELDLGAWVGTELLPSGGDFRLGEAVDVLGDQLVLGARDGNLGIAYSFERDAGGAWNETGLLQASDGMDNDDFGEAVALAPGVLFIGAKEDDEAPFEDSGSVYVFEGGPGAVALSISGSCPGTMTLTVQTAEPNQDVILYQGRNPGTTVIAGGGCDGTELGLDGAKRFRKVVTDGTGLFELTTPVSNRRCGTYMQGHDRACAVSNLLQIPE